MGLSRGSALIFLESISGYQLSPWTLTFCDVLSTFTSSEVMCGLLTQSRRLEDLCVLARPVPAKFRSTCSPVPTGSARVPTGSKRVSLGCHGILCSILGLKQIYPWLFGWWDVLAPERARIALLSDQNLESSVFQRFYTTKNPTLFTQQQPRPPWTTTTTRTPYKKQLLLLLLPNPLEPPTTTSRTHSTPATQTKHNNNPNRLKQDSNAQTTAPTSLPHHNTSPPVTTTRTSWNVNSNNPNLLGQHKQPIVVVKCAVQQKPWMTDDQENLNEDSSVSQRTWMESNTVLLFPFKPWALSQTILNKNDGRLKSNDYDSLTCTCYSWDKWQEGRKDVFSHTQPSHSKYSLKDNTPVLPQRHEPSSLNDNNPISWKDNHLNLTSKTTFKEDNSPNTSERQLQQPPQKQQPNSNKKQQPHSIKWQQPLLPQSAIRPPET